jgi:hypothetical protein
MVPRNSATLTAVVMSMLSGKTTGAQAGLLIDPDSMMTPFQKDHLQRLKTQGDWAQHNIIYTASLQRMAAAIPAGSTVALHHPVYIEALEKGGRTVKAYRYHPTIEEFGRRLILIAKGGDAGRAELAVRNRADLLGNRVYNDLPWWPLAAKLESLGKKESKNG